MTAEQSMKLQRHEIAVLDSTMSYVEAGGNGPAVLFLHGNPTSSYIWRNIIPHVAPVGRCLAPDLIGYGQSGKPDIAYRFFDQVRYLDAFIEKTGIGEMVLVAQDWGTALAFHLASRRPHRILGLAFMEFIRPFDRWEDFHQRDEARDLFKAFRTPGRGEKLVVEDNIFIERVLPASVMRKLSDEEMGAYRAPFPTPASRKPILSMPNEMPIEGLPADVASISEHDHRALRLSAYPKILFHGEPGALVSPAAANAFAATLTDCKVINLGPGAHYLQEDHADAIGIALRSWIPAITAKERKDTAA
ncbi:MAG: haloalkane dehalogenase [Mesorhizobium sp.]